MVAGTTKTNKELMQQADAILGQAGIGWWGRKKGEVPKGQWEFENRRIIKTPVGGQPGGQWKS